VSNREMCRDELLALLREASSLRQSFGRSKQATASQTGPPSMHNYKWQIVKSILMLNAVHHVAFQ
jgi:hypothetical protein